MIRIQSKTHSAFVILNRKREHVATVTLQYPRDGAGRVTANVCNVTRDAQQRSAARYLATHGKAPRGPGASEDGLHLWLQCASAGGYGYDKATAALAGLIVDGYTLADHCGRVPEAEKARTRLMAAYAKACDVDAAQANAATWRDKAKRIGVHFANWTREDGRYTSLHFRAGLQRLEDLGYTVIGAL